MSEAVLKNKEQEIKDIARKAALMTPQSIKTLIFATDVLLARDQMEPGDVEISKSFSIG